MRNIDREKDCKGCRARKEKMDSTVDSESKIKIKRCCWKRMGNREKVVVER